MDSQSPLRFLDYDVTQYIYETYYPSKEARILKKKMNEHRIQNLIDVERETGLYSKKTYDDYKQNILNIVESFKKVVEHVQGEYPVIGYGAAAKGNTFLNFADIS